MKIVFVFTDDANPEVRTLKNVVSIEAITESDVDKYKVTQSDATVTKFPAASGQIAIFWE